MTPLFPRNRPELWHVFCRPGERALTVTPTRTRRDAMNKCLVAGDPTFEYR